MQGQLAALFERSVVNASSQHEGMYAAWMQQHPQANTVPLAHLYAAVVEKVKVWVGNWFCKAMAMSFKLGIDIIVLNLSGMLLFTKTSITAAESSGAARMKLSPTSLQPQADIKKDGLSS